VREIGNPHDPTAVAVQKNWKHNYNRWSHSKKISSMTTVFKIKYGPLLPDSTCLIISAMLLFALLIADYGTLLLNDLCGSGNFL